ncbi:MAG: hypothetical protein K6G61_09960 [Solobacterium sp.]|nr:hypothetical protein [Solobacterium sp.]
MNKTFKQILAGCKAGFDVVMMLYFLFDLISGYDVGVDLFVLALFTTDLFLSIDYIRMLEKQKKDENFNQILAQRRMQERISDDRNMAHAIRRDLEASQELSPEEMAELLGNQNENRNQKLPY